MLADALIAWIVATFAVDRRDDDASPQDLRHDPVGVLRTTTLLPRSSAAAPLTFVYTSFPGIDIHAGATHAFPFPACGCDACDDDIDTLADDLEWLVKCVVAGRYNEREAWYRLCDGDGNEQSGTSATDGSDFTAHATHRPDGEQWHAWPMLTR